MNKSEVEKDWSAYYVRLWLAQHRGLVPEDYDTRADDALYWPIMAWGEGKGGLSNKELEREVADIFDAPDAMARHKSVDTTAKHYADADKPDEGA